MKLIHMKDALLNYFQKHHDYQLWEKWLEHSPAGQNIQIYTTDSRDVEHKLFLGSINSDMIRGVLRERAHEMREELDELEHDIVKEIRDN